MGSLPSRSRPHAGKADDLVVRVVETEEDRQAAFAIRIRVFVEEQGIPAQEELDEDDEKATHAIALSGGKPVGTGRVLYQEPGEARIGRMAVESDWRRRGVGSGILRTLEDAARRDGMTQAVLHAQTYVKTFYAAHGYVEEGEGFLEVGIEHVRMRKAL